DENSFSNVVTVSSSTPDPVTTNNSASANTTITEADVLAVVSAPTIATIEGGFFSGAVASFSVPNSEPTGDFIATIDWGDGTTSAGTVSGPTFSSSGPSGSTGTFTVSGAHTYTNSGSFTVGVTLADDAPGTAAATATGAANVALADLLVPIGTP